MAELPTWRTHRATAIGIDGEEFEYSWIEGPMPPWAGLDDMLIARGLRTSERDQPIRRAIEPEEPSF